MTRKLAPFLATICLLVPAAAVAQPLDSEEEKALHASYENLLRERGVALGGPDLLRFFRERTLSQEQIAEFNDVLARLHAPSYKIRAGAEEALAAKIKLVFPLVVRSAADASLPLETRRRLEVLLKKFAGADEPRLAEAVVFVSARQKPASAAQTLLAYLPFASNPQVVQAIREALPLVALEDGKPAPGVLAALGDAHARCRAFAAEALIRAAGLARKADVAPLLKDSQPIVRWHVLSALAHAKDKEAVPGVIALLGELDRDRLWEVEELLMRIAGDKGPGVYLGTDTTVAKVQLAWSNWWEANKAGVSLDKLAESAALLGHTLITQMGLAGINGGKVMEVRASKEVAWEIDGLRYPVDARVIAKGHVLIAEYLGRRVTERDFKGNIVWEKMCAMPIACQRLPNGDTFIAGRRQLLIVKPDGSETFNFAMPALSIAAAHRLKDGTIMLVNAGGFLQHLDEAGNELRSFKVGQVYPLGGSIDVYGDKVLVPAYRENRLIEYSRDGKELWSISYPTPVSATRLPGGNILVVGQGDMRVVEIDRAGNEVWSLGVEGRAWRARKR